MVKALTKLYNHKKNYHAFNVLPDLVKTNFSVKEKNYSIEKMTLTISGNLSIKKLVTYRLTYILVFAIMVLFLV